MTQPTFAYSSSYGARASWAFLSSKFANCFGSANLKRHHVAKSARSQWPGQAKQYSQQQPHLQASQSRSAKPAGTITPSSSPAGFRTGSARSNLHSVRRPSHPTSRALLHWRLSDDGPVQAASSRSAVIRNPSQKRTHLPAANSIMSRLSRTIDLRGFNWQAFCSKGQQI